MAFKNAIIFRNSLVVQWTGLHRARQMWHTGLAALWQAGSSRIRDRTRVSCIGRQVLCQWATREGPQMRFKWFLFFSLFIFGCTESSLLARTFSTCGEWGLLLVAVCGLPIEVASQWSMGSRCVGFSSCGTRAQQLLLWALEDTLNNCGVRA